MSGIVVSIKAGNTLEKSRVTATGKIVHIITDSERYSFGIGSDGDLKRAIGIFCGKEPNEAYLHDPTPPYGDIYKKYGWPEVQLVLEPKKAEILEITSEPTIVSTQVLTNESKNTAVYSSKITDQVSNTISNEWSFSAKLSVEQTIRYALEFLGTGGGTGSETKIGLELPFGLTEKVTKQTTVGMETAVNVGLKPGESAVVELSASSGRMRIRITYEAYLTGWAAVHYDQKYAERNFWAHPIGGVVRVIGSQKVQITEDIEVGFYSNAKANVRNKATLEKMAFYMADHAHE